MSEFLDLNHTSKSMILVSLMIPKFAPAPDPQTLANFGIGTLAAEPARLGAVKRPLLGRAAPGIAVIAPAAVNAVSYTHLTLPTTPYV